MNRSRRAALAALCVLALALGAATLNSPVSDDGGFGGAGSSGFDDQPVEDPGGIQPENGTRDLGSAINLSGLCIEFFTSSTFFLIVLVGALLLGSIVYRKGGMLLVFATYAVIFSPGLVLWMLVTTCGQKPPPRGATNFTLFPGENGTIFNGAAGGGGPGNGMPSLATTILLLLGVAVVLVGILMLRASGDDEAEGPQPEAEPEDPAESLVGLAGVAADAADRIESGDGDTENEVYRAWREMTGYLDVPNPRTSTPAEFREAAREVGMADRHVDALTDLFRDVRYGGAAVTEDREAAAVDALRAIEDAYGEGGGGDGS